MANDKHIALKKRVAVSRRLSRVQIFGLARVIRFRLARLWLKVNVWRVKWGMAAASEADLDGANLIKARLSKANLRKADLSGALLIEANLREADLGGADLWSAALVGTDLTGADLTGCLIHGVSAWRLKLDTRTKQQNLVITRRGEPAITVDNIEVAQFVHLLLHNEKIRDVIDTITSKAVLILGRLTDERKVSSKPFGRNCASVITCRSYLTLSSQEAAIRTKRSRCSPAWRGLSLPMSLMPKPCCRSCVELCRTFPRCPCNRSSSRNRRSRACSTSTGTGRRFCRSTATPIRSNCLLISGQGDPSRRTKGSRARG